MKTKKLCLMLFATILASLTQAATIPVSFDPNLNKRLGTGFNSRNQNLFSVCVTNKKADGSVPDRNLKNKYGFAELKLEKDEKKMSNRFELNANGRYKTGVSEAKASANFLNETKSNAFSLSYNYIAEYSYTEYLEDDPIFPIRPLDNHRAALKSVSDFFEECGDEYVSAVNYAARLFVSINVSFVSKSEKTRFAAEVNFSSPTGGLDVKNEVNSTSYSSRNELTVQIHQFGGDAAKMGKILCPTQVEGKADVSCEESSRVIVKCSFGDLRECTKILEKAIAYAHSQDDNNFPHQIKNHTNYSEVSLLTSTYKRLGTPFPRPPTVQEEKALKDARDAVTDIFDKQHELHTLTVNLSNSKAPRLSDRQKSRMEELRSLHHKNVETAVDAVVTCYEKDYKACLAAGKKLRDLIGLTQNGNIEKEQERAIYALTDATELAQYCDISDDNHPEIRQTVNALRQFVVTKKIATQERLDRGDKCDNLQQFLQNVEEIDWSDLPEHPIGALEPLVTLKKLKILRLPGQQLTSIDLLSQLESLVELNLDENLISDVSPLEKLKSLQTLSLRKNAATAASVAKLAALKRLRRLDMRGNQTEVRCPLEQVTYCKIKSFSDYAQVSTATTVCPFTKDHQAIALDSSRVLIAGGRSKKGPAQMQVVDNSTGQCVVAPKSLNKTRVGHTLSKTPQGILVIGGDTETLELINPETLESKIINGALQEPVAYHTATSLRDGRVLVVGGRTSRSDSKVESVSQWVQLVDGGGNVQMIGRLHVPRSRHTATLLSDGRVLIVGGYSQNEMISNVEIIDVDQRTISPVQAVMPRGRADHTAALLKNGHVVIIGGTTRKTEKCGSAVCEVEAPVEQILDFDPETKKFRVVSEKMNPARAKMQSIVTSDHRILLMGGLEKSKVLISGEDPLMVKPASTLIEVYDPESEALYPVGKMSDRRVGFTATPVGSASVLVFGGAPSLKEIRNGDMFERFEEDTLSSSTEFLTYFPRP